MNWFCYIFIITFSLSCGFSPDKTPLQFKQLGPTIAAIEELPPGVLVNFATIQQTIMPKCISCHSNSSGNAGAVNLETYENVTAHLSSIKSEVMSDSMPKNRPKLSPFEKSMLFTWIDAGGPLEIEPAPPVEFITYEEVHTKVIQPRCIGCHSVAGGNRANVNLENYENVKSVIGKVEATIKNGTMPRPVNRPLTPEQKELILKWIIQGAPEGGELL